jgi:hypothetical protein
MVPHLECECRHRLPGTKTKKGDGGTAGISAIFWLRIITSELDRP